MAIAFLNLGGFRALDSAEVGAWRSGYTIYNPAVTIHTVYSGQSHDSALVYFDRTWVAQWDGGTEKAPQYIYQSTSMDLSTWTTPITPYMAAAGATHPITGAMQWQPSLLMVGSQLWSFFCVGKNVYLSKLDSSTGTWTNTAIFGPGTKSGDPEYPAGSGNHWSLFPGNAGTILSDGTIVVPVTYQLIYPPLSKRPNWFKQPKRDGLLLSTDSGSTWTALPGATYGDDGSQCWENTVWEPAAGILNMISRNNRAGPRLLPEQNLKSTTSSDEGSSWAAEALIPQSFAMSRPHVIRKGERNLLAQNDWPLAAPLSGNRRNLSLFFSRGNRSDDFVAGLNFCVNDGDALDTTRVDYPQIATNGSTCAVIYTNFGNNDGNGKAADTATKVASFTLPSDSNYYIFPRQGYDSIDTVDFGGRRTAQFNDDYCSAGIDIDGNTASNTLCVSFAVYPDTSGGRQCIFNLSNGVKLFSDNGRLAMKEWHGGSSIEVDCGALPLGAWSTVDFISGNGMSRARANGGVYMTVNNAPYPWRSYFGDNTYDFQPAKKTGEKFYIDLSSIKTLVQ